MKHIAILGAASALLLSVTVTRPVVADTSIDIRSPACEQAGGGALFCFMPEFAKGKTGMPVTWANRTDLQHTVTLCTPSACPGAPASTGGDSFDVSIGDRSSGSHTFETPGTYYYYCRIHTYAGMHGEITITGSTITPATTPTPPTFSLPPPAPVSQTPAPVPTETSTAAPSASPSVSAAALTPLLTPSPSASPAVAAVPSSEGGGGFPVLPTVLVLVLLGVAGGAALYARRVGRPT